MFAWSCSAVSGKRWLWKSKSGATLIAQIMKLGPFAAAGGVESFLRLVFDEKGTTHVKDVNWQPVHQGCTFAFLRQLWLAAEWMENQPWMMYSCISYCKSWETCCRTLQSCDQRKGCR